MKMKMEKKRFETPSSSVLKTPDCVSGIGLIVAVLPIFILFHARVFRPGCNC